MRACGQNRITWQALPVAGLPDGVATGKITACSEPADEAIAISTLQRVPVAQLDRASASGAEGYRFESCRGYLMEGLVETRITASEIKPISTSQGPVSEKLSENG